MRKIIATSAAILAALLLAGCEAVAPWSTDAAEATDTAETESARDEGPVRLPSGSYQLLNGVLWVSPDLVPQFGFTPTDATLPDSTGADGAVGEFLDFVAVDTTGALLTQESNGSLTVSKLRDPSGGPDGDEPPIILPEGGSEGARVFFATLREAYQNDPRLSAALLRVDAKVIETRLTGDLFQPNLTLGASTFTDGVTLTATHPIYDFGKRRTRADRVRAEGGVEEYELARARESLLQSALTASLQAEFAQARIELHNRQITAFLEAEAAANRLAELNLLTESDVRLAGVQYQRAEADLAAAERDLAAAQRLWGRLSNSNELPPRIDTFSLRIDAGIENQDVAYSQALINNLALRRLARQEVLIIANQKVLERSNTPTVNAVAEGTLNSQGDFEDNVGLQLNYTLFQGQQRAQVAQLDGQLVSLASERDALTEDLVFEINDAARIAEAELELAERESASIALLEARVRDLERQLETGLVLYTNVIEAQADVFEAELSALTSLNRAARADADIILLTGVLVP